VEYVLAIQLHLQDWYYNDFWVSYIGENIVGVTIWDKHEVVFVNVITNTIINTIYIGHEC
jgi:hypothetical protein